MITELNEYGAMISDIQGYKVNFFKNLQNNFSLKNILIFGLLFPMCMIIFYFFIIVPKKSLIFGFLSFVFYCFCWEACLFTLFDKVIPYIYLLLYDCIIVSGGSMFISQYLLYNHYDILKKYTLLIFILFLLSFILFCNACYKYNPDLSNIKGIVLF
jgi:hypothetical protein